MKPTLPWHQLGKDWRKECYRSMSLMNNTVKCLNKTPAERVTKVTHHGRVGFVCSATSRSLQPHGQQLPGPLPVGSSRQEYWGGVQLLPAGDLPNPRTEPSPPMSLLQPQTDSLPLAPSGKPKGVWEGNRQEGQGSPNGGKRLQVPDIFISLKQQEETNQQYFFFSTQI